MKNKTDYQADAMEAIFSFCEAMDKGKLSIDDLREVMKLAVASGWDRINICLSMATVAIEHVHEPISRPAFSASDSLE